MKKRLLSAALAFAMVLTLLPATIVPAFAVDYGTPEEKSPLDWVKSVDKDGNPTSWYAHYNSEKDTYTGVTVTYQTASDNTTKREAGKWYWLDNTTDKTEPTYYWVDDGLVSGTGNSGTWYPSFAMFTKDDNSLRGTSFTMLGDVDARTVLVNTNTKAPTSLTIDVNGFDLNLPTDLPDKFSSLTITNRRNPLTNSGSVDIIAKNTQTRPYANPAVTYSNLTVTVSNTTVGSVDLKGGTNTVTLNNVSVGAVTMDGKTQTQTKAQSEMIPAKFTDAYNKQTLNANVTDAGRLSTATTFGGAIDITGDGSVLKLNNAKGGATATVDVVGNGGSITVNGASDLGDVTVASRKGATAVPPSVAVDSGSVGKILRDMSDPDAKESTKENVVTVSGTARVIDTDNGKVTVNKGKVKNNLTVKAGSVTLTGPVEIGSVLLGKNGKTTLSISGTGSVIGSITAVKGANLTISPNGWPTGRDNNFGVLNLDTYQGRGVKGGTFTNDANLKDSDNALWFDTDLQYVVDMQDGNFSLYGKNEMARAISDITSTTAATAGGTPTTVAMNVLCHEGDYHLILMNGGITWAKIGYDVPVGMILPQMVNGYDVATWTSGDNESSVPSGKEQTIGKPATGTEFTLHANGAATTVAKSITGVAASANPKSPVENQDVRVTLNGTNIAISGAIVPAPGSSIATIELDLTTDALVSNVPDATTGGGSGSGAPAYIVLKNVEVFYNVDTKAVEFNTLQKIDGGAIVNDAGELVLNNGTGTHYTVSASLTQSASNLGLYPDGNEVQVTIGGSLASRTQTEKDEIIAAILGSGATAAEFKINGNRAILEAINAAQATFTSTTSVSNLVTTAQNYVWKNGNKYVNATTGQPNGLGKGDGKINPHTGNLSITGTFGNDGKKIQDKYAKAYIVPYLVVNVTNQTKTGTLNATLSVYYRIDVSADPYDPDEYYTVQAGRALSALTGDMATSPVKVRLAATSTQMHQDGKYVYEKNAAAPADAAANNGNPVIAQYDGWLITHAGTNGNGLGTVVIDNTAGPITMSSTISLRAPALVQGVSYDDLQAAIDDTVPGWTGVVGSATGELLDTVTIGGTYEPTECVVTMAGVARKIAVVSDGNRKISSNTNSVDVQSQNGINYTIELKRDNVINGNIDVTEVENGLARVSANPAKVGSTVTITTVPANGYVLDKLVVKTAGGATVTVKPVEDTTNRYNFVMPAGSVTVTPSFKKGTATQATVSVSNTNKGNVVTTADTTDSKVTPGSSVGVSTYPANGYRTMDLRVTTNGGTATTTRVSDDYFTFTVPTTATAVTVTPVYDVDNGTKFTDVWSTEYYSKSVSWAVKNGITTGQSEYTFGSNNVCTRAQMVTFLWRAAGKPTVGNVSNPFVDVYPGMGTDYYNAILWARSKGITDGVDSTHFGPSQYVTRAQAVTFLYRFENSPASSVYNAFNDVSADKWFAKEVTWAANKGITNGKTATSFAPGDYCTRAMIVTFLYRDRTGDIT